MSTNLQNFGKQGEEITSDFLIKKGYKILCRNWHSRFGEVDIIAQKNNQIIFIEVKTRKTDSMGSGIESVTRKKINKIIRTGISYLNKNNIQYKSYKIEIVVLKLENSSVNIKHYKSIDFY